METMINNSVLAWKPRASTAHKSESRITQKQAKLAESGLEAHLMAVQK
jgi:hypothetical protein